MVQALKFSASDLLISVTYIAGFLEYGGAFQSNNHDDIKKMNSTDIKKAKAYFRANGKAVVLSSDVSELCLQLAAEKLKTIFRDVLQKEKSKEDSKK